MTDTSAAPVDRRLARLLRLMPDACLRIRRDHCVLYSAHGGGRVFRTEDPRVALWIMGFTRPRSAWQVLHECPVQERQAVSALLTQLCELGILAECDSVPDEDLESEHLSSVAAVATLTQSVYSLASDLRGLGPAGHAGLRDKAELSLRHRIESLLANIDSLRADLAALRAPVVQRQLDELGVDAASRDLQLHIGSGGFDLPGWINIDSHPAPLAMSLDWGLPFRPASARFVFLSHLLEHLFHPFQSQRLLEDIRRVLQPGGVVRIVVPDIEQCINAYVANDRAFFANRNDHFASPVENPTRLERFLAYAGAGPSPSHLIEAHKFGYDVETLQHCLQRAGFVNIRRCNYQSSPFEALRVDHASLNAVARNGDRHYSLFVEAQAPAPEEARLS